METVNMTKTCNLATAQAGRPDVKDWGFSLMADNELQALRVAYAYRNNPHGVKVEHCPNVGRFMVTVFNATAARCGIDT